MLVAAEDCFELGRIAYTSGDYYHTVLWMQEAKALWEQETEKTIAKESILDYLAFSLSMVSCWVDFIIYMKVPESYQ